MKYIIIIVGILVILSACACLKVASRADDIEEELETKRKNDEKIAMAIESNRKKEDSLK